MLSKSDIKLIKSLKHKKYRQLHKLFIAEGERLVSEALSANALINQILLTDSFIANENNQNIISLITKNNVPSEVIAEHQFKSISETVTPSGVLALCKMPKKIYFNKNNDDNLLYLDTIQDPGNLGTLLRSANWFGITNVALSNNCIDAYNPKVVRAAMGAHFHLNIYNNINLNNFDKHTKLGALMQGESTHYLKDKIFEPWVLVIGNEAHGISSENHNLLDKKLYIPKIGKGESLNAAMAGSILLYYLTAPLLSDQ
jgi:TrmH family RNA methyltransferase